MGFGLADHLAALDRASPARLLAERPDACAEPVPQDLERLADRLHCRVARVRDPSSRSRHP